VLIVGRSDGVGIGQADLFRANVQANGALAVTNLSGTSGDVQTPFDYGHLNTADGIFQLSASSWLVHEPAYDDDDDLRDDDSSGELLWIDGGAGVARTLLDHVQSLDLLETAGSYWVASVHRSNGGQPLNLLQIPPGGLGATASAIPACCHLNRPASLAASNEFAAVLELQDGERLGRFQAPSPTGIVLGSQPLTFGPTLGFDRNGTLFGSAARANDWVVFAWSRTGVTLVRALDAGFFLPGL